MIEQGRAGVGAPELRKRYFTRWAASALVVWAALWAMGAIKYGPLGTVIFIVASLGSIWMAAWMRAARVADNPQRVREDATTQTDAESKKAA
jgi:hypothetical protein